MATTVRLDAPSESTVGRAVRLVAIVSADGGGVPRGDVVFSAGARPLGRAPVRGGSATLVTLSLAIGEHQLTAAYLGDDRHQASTSSRVAHAVRRQ